MPRLTVSIPQDLHDRLEHWRDHLNISRVCQRALDREVRRLEELPQDAHALGTLVERLSREKADGDRAWFSQGVADGMTWAQGASYIDLRETAEKGVEATPEITAVVSRRMSRHEEELGFEPESYIEGWRFAASELWRRVKDKI
jgi:hypothetical protein